MEAMQSTLKPIAPATDDKERLFQCSTCKRSFTRVDHLMRHVRAHTKQKPYVCPTCSKGFARVDLLKRHSANHSSGSASKRQKKEIVRQSRVVQACEACSFHHLRCEDEKPCSRCKKRNIACRVPDSDEQTELDAAQGLLEFSHHSDLEQYVQVSAEQRFADEPFESLGEMTAVASSHIQPSPHNASSDVTSDLNSTGEPSGSFTSYMEQPVSLFSNESTIDPFLPDYVRNMQLDKFPSGFATPRNTIDLSFSWDMDFSAYDFDSFNVQESMEANFLPLELQTSTQQHNQTTSHDQTDEATARAEAFKTSVWRYIPPNINPSIADETHLALPDGDHAREPHPQIPSRRIISERLPFVSRDRVLALVLSTSDAANAKRISSGFPSLDLLDGLIQIFFTAPSVNAASLFHVPTFSPAKLTPELLCCVVATGACSLPDVALQKLGLALQEACFQAVADVVGSDNSVVRDLQFLQLQLLQLELGMWSGISRKLEIAESFLNVPITMLRRGGRFRHSTWKNIVPNDEDSEAALQAKWKDWISQEAWLRMVHRYFEFDRQSSMALIKPPLISYSEMRLPVTSSDQLWCATSASTWKEAYLSNPSNSAKRPAPSDCIHALDSLNDQEPTNVTHLYILWGMVWDYRQMATATTSPTPSSELLLSSRYQELLRLCENFRVSMSQPDKHADIVLEVLLMHLHVPMEDIQTFAGVAGPDEARHTFPALRDWAVTVSARQGLWHAAQTLRLTETLPKGTLRNFYAMMVYNAGLVTWVYGLIRRHESSPSSESSVTSVNLNCEEHMDGKRFIKLNRGEPTLKRRTGPQEIDIPLTDPPEIIGLILEILKQNHDHLDGAVPSLVDSLLNLMEGLRSVS